MPQTPQLPTPARPATSSQQLAHSTLDNLLVIKDYPDFTYPQGWTVLIYYYFSGMLVISQKTYFFLHYSSSGAKLLLTVRAIFNAGSMCKSHEK